MSTLPSHRGSHRAPTELVSLIRRSVDSYGLAGTIETLGIQRTVVERIQGDLTMREGTITSACIRVGLGVPVFKGGFGARAEVERKPARVQSSTTLQPTVKPAA